MILREINIDKSTILSIYYSKRRNKMEIKTACLIFSILNLLSSLYYGTIKKQYDRATYDIGFAIFMLLTAIYTQL